MKMIKQAILFLIKAYQDYISKFTPKSCRYYPSCSEFAVWQFKFNGFFSALFAVIFRILRCNQLFKGGIDYPVISKNFDSFFISNQNLKSHIAFWFVPYKKNKFYVIKNLDFQKEKQCQTICQFKNACYQRPFYLLSFLQLTIIFLFLKICRQIKTKP